MLYKIYFVNCSLNIDSYFQIYYNHFREVGDSCGKVKQYNRFSNDLVNVFFTYVLNHQCTEFQYNYT